jgi:anaerobic selenocysteine-containing dehydrogenase
LRTRKITRRTFIKASGGAAATIALSHYLFGWSSKPLLGSSSGGTSINEKWVPTTCWIGKQECGVLARVVDGRIVKLEGHPDHPRNRGTLCVKGQAQLMSVYDPYRVKAPLLRTNDKGGPGEWRQVSWDDALNLVADKIREVRQKDKRLLLWQKGRSKAKDFYDDAFVKASGATKVGHGAYCSDAAYRAMEYTFGFHGGIHPDFRYCNYLLAWGWGLTSSGGNKLCWLTWPREFVEARERGMKVATIDPWLRSVGPHTDQWLPIKPGSDLAFFLALANLLIETGYVDREYLTKHTNGPFLVGADGFFLREGDKELVWDLNTSLARPYDAAGVSPALEGTYTVNGSSYKTSFQLLAEHLRQYTPEWASSASGISADTIRTVAGEMGKAASIGSKIVVDGVEVPYRPVGIMAYHVSQQELGFQAFRAAGLVIGLLGSIEAAGGSRVDFSRGLHKNWDALDSITIKDKPDNFYLKNSKYFPINSANPGIYAKAMIDPDKYGVDYVPEVMILHMANPLLSFLGQDTFIEAYKKLKFVAVIDPFMSETADYFADVVLPAATMEKYEGVMSVGDQYTSAKSMRIPPIPPLYESRGEIDIYLDLCERAGILEDYLSVVNGELKLKDEYALDLNNKPSTREILDRWSQQNGYDGGIEYFEKHGVKVSQIPSDEFYAPAWDKPYGGIRHRLYGESLLRYQGEMKGKGAEQIYWQDYTALPTWRTPTMLSSPAEYDIYLISHKKVEYKQSRNELEPEQLVEMNAGTAEEKGIHDDDWVWVESHNAVTGEKKRIKAKAKLMEGIRPDTVTMSHHYGFWVHPGAREGGPTPNSIFPAGEGYITNTADQSYQVRVKVTKA